MGGMKRREIDPASNQFPKCSPQPIIQTDSQGWVQKREEGDRDDLTEKKRVKRGRE